MKKLFSIFLLVFVPSVLMAQEERPPLRIMSGQTIVGSGTSTVIVDLNRSNMVFPNFGNFTLQLGGVTLQYAPLSGATINSAYRISSKYPSVTGMSDGFAGILTGTSTIDSNLESTNIFTSLVTDSGDTEYQYGFYPVDKSSYLIIDITAGSTNVVTDAYLDWN